MAHEEVPLTLEYVFEILVGCEIIWANQMVHELQQGELPVNW